ncbi:MAG: Prenyltransferase, UbiA family [uncultured bacterium]|nr:MAG: Prenyltransferase, UbiA family [uncultured bacterium]
MLWLRLIRLQQWAKNFLLFAPLLFALQFSINGWLTVSLGFVAFSLLASAAYIMNDLIDVAADRIHPMKRLRPLASNQLSQTTAAIGAALLLMMALGISVFLPWQFGVILLSYGLMNVLYSCGLKKIVLIDVIIISIGFVLRILAGSALIAVTTSHWILLCTFFGSLFIGFAKRKHEVDSLADHSKEHRNALQYYSAGLLQQLIGITATLTIISYSLYTIDEQTIDHFQTDKLYLTIIFVAFAIFHYFHIIYNQATSGDPTKTFLSDKPLLITLVLWLISFFTIVFI